MYYTQNINGLNTPRVSRSRGRDKCLLQSLLLSLLLMLIILNTSKYFYSVAPPSSCTMGELEKLSHYNFEEYQCLDGARGGVVVKTLRYKQQVAGSIPYGVIGIFQRHNPSVRTMALGLTHPLTEMSTRCFSWG